MIASEQNFLTLSEWYQTPLGRMVAGDIAEHLNFVLPRCFGYHILQLGVESQRQWLDLSPIKHKIYLSDDNKAENVNLVSGFHQLPFASASIDVVVVPHTLAFVECPHAVMAEIDRVLVAEGHVIIIGFNALSWFGLAKTFMRYSNEAPWNGQYFSIFRIMRFLRNCGYWVDHVQDFFHRPPFESQRLLDKMAFFETLGRLAWPFPGGLYMLHAKKQTSAFTPIRPIFRIRSLVVGKSTARSV